MNQNKSEELKNSSISNSSTTNLGVKGTIYLTSKAYFKMMFYCQLVSTEIGGLLLVTKKGGRNIIEDAVLLKQDVSGGGVNLDTEAVCQFMVDNPKLVPKIGGWWHSHVTMGTFFSGIDLNTSHEMARIAGGKTIAIVVSNNSNNFNMLVGTSNGKKMYIIPEVRYEQNDMLELIQSCQDEIKDKVKQKVWPYWPANVTKRRKQSDLKYYWEKEEEDYEQPSEFRYPGWDF